MSEDTKHGLSCSEKVDRRKFLGVAAATAGMLFIKPELVRGTAANSAVRVGLLGCGGRGTEDATNLIDTGGARVVALADLFQDQLDKARENFNKCNKRKATRRWTPHNFSWDQTLSSRLPLQRKWTPS